MSTFKRYRVRAGGKAWGGRGPDLLRKRADAEKAFRKLIRVGTRGLRVRFRKTDGKWSPWSEPMSRRKMMRHLHAWEPRGDADEFQASKGGKVRAAARMERVPYVELSRVHPDVEVTWSLIHYQFPNVVFAGGFVYKKRNSTDWSDHAWGDAVDGTPRGKGVSNDGLFDWQVRMGRGGNLPVHGYILGSKGGKVKQAYASLRFAVMPGIGWSSTHLWHNHDSIIDHHGAKPPDANGRQ